MPCQVLRAATSETDPFGAVRELEVGGGTYSDADLTALEERSLCDLERLPVSVRTLLESVLRTVDGEREDGSRVEFPVTTQVNTPATVEYAENGGSLLAAPRRLLTA